MEIYQNQIVTLNGWRYLKKFNSIDNLCPKENVPNILIDENNPKNLPNFLSLRICAIRETFEECGILICRKNGPQYYNSISNQRKSATYLESKKILQWREKIYNNPSEFINFCKETDCCPDIWALNIWSNWVTPPSFKSRFNTIFFLTTFNQLPSAFSDGKEVQNILWRTSIEYLRDYYNGELIFPIPQYYELCRLQNFSNVEKLTIFAYERSQLGCEVYLPHRILTNKGLYTIFPGDDLYPKYIDNNKEIAKMDELPQTKIKNRIYHKTSTIHELDIENFIPKAKHIPPIPYK